MTPLAALALIAILPPQGPVGPAVPTGPIVVPPKPVVGLLNLIGNPGFEASTANPWQTGGKVSYYDESPDGLSATLVSQGLWGTITSDRRRTGKASFRMNSQFPSYVVPGAGNSSNTYVRQSLAQPVAGSAIYGASVWVSARNELMVTVEYTSGQPTSQVAGFYDSGWTQWDFRSAIDDNRTVKAIRFDSHASYDYPYSASFDTWIDDVNVSILVRL